MNKANRIFAAASAAFFIATTASAQNDGTVTNNAFAIGKGPGTSGFAAVLCNQAELAIGQNAAKPICKALSGDVTMSATGVVSINSNFAKLNAANLFTGVNTFKSTQIDANSDLWLGTAGIPQIPADATPALQSALNARQHLVLPCGTFYITSKLEFGFANQTLSGCGREGTILRFTAGTANFMIETTFQGTTLADLTLDMNYNAGISQGCYQALGAPLSKVIRVGCINTPDSATSTAGGFGFASTDNTAAHGSWGSQLRDCYVGNMNTTNNRTDAGAYNAHAVMLNYSDYTTVSGCTSYSIDNGVNTQASNYVVIANNTWAGNGRNITGFPGVRCSNGTFGSSITGNVITNMVRGIFLLGCTNTTVVGNSITNTQFQSILISATTGNASPTQFNTITGNSMQSTCLANGCNWPIEVNQSGGGFTRWNMVNGNVYAHGVSPVNTAMIGLTGPAAGANTCVNNTSDIAIGSC